MISGVEFPLAMSSINQVFPHKKPNHSSQTCEKKTLIMMASALRRKIKRIGTKVGEVMHVDLDEGFSSDGMKKGLEV